MPSLTVELPRELLKRLEQEAAKRQQPVEELVAQLLEEERLSEGPSAESGE